MYMMCTHSGGILQVDCTFYSSNGANRASETVDLGTKDGGELDPFAFGTQ